MAAVVFVLNHFEVYLLGHKIIVHRDHQALVSDYLSFMKGQSKGLLSRRYLKIAQFLPDLVLEHKPGLRLLMLCHKQPC